jgi:stress response protein YsnF
MQVTLVPTAIRLFEERVRAEKRQVVAEGLRVGKRAVQNIGERQ